LALIVGALVLASATIQAAPTTFTAAAVRDQIIII
jgi:hypothetical protein